MYVYVHAGGRQRHGQGAHGIRADGDPPFAYLFQYLGQKPAAHRAPVDVKALMGPGGLGQIPHPNAAENAHAAAACVHHHGFFRGFRPVYGKQRMLQAAVAKAVIDLFSVIDKSEGHPRIAQYHPGRQIVHQRPLIIGLFQKRAAHGHVIKQIPHYHRGPLRASGLFHGLFYSSVDFQPHAAGRALLPGGHLHVRYRRNGRQCLAPEAQGANVVQLFGGFQFRRGVVFEGQRHLGRRDAAAVVRHPQRIDAAVFDVDGHGGSPCVNGVFNQLLGHRRGAFHHLARGDAPHYGRIQYPDRHSISP